MGSQVANTLSLRHKTTGNVASRMTASQADNIMSDPSSFIDVRLFKKYVGEFPCLRGFRNLDPRDLESFRDGLGSDADASSRELAVDCILELLSGGDFQITWKDIFDIFSSEDQRAFIRVMLNHGSTMKARSAFSPAC